MEALGVSLVRGRVTYDDQAPLADVRKAMVHVVTASPR